MTMRIGHTLFGGAVTGLVIASGAASCVANASTHGVKNVIVQSTAISTCTATGTNNKQVSNKGSAFAFATGTGNCKGTFNPLPVSISCGATVSSSTIVYYKSYGNITATATATTTARRIAKALGVKAEGKATGEADGFVWQIGYADTAYATAGGYGTTYQVGYGSSISTATISAAPIHIVGVEGTGLISATAVGTCVHKVGASGLGVVTSKTCVDAAVVKAGIRYLTANGIGECKFTGELTHVNIHQAQVGIATATIHGRATCYVGVSTNGKAYASGKGFSEIIATNGKSDTAYATCTAVQVRYVYYALAKSTGSAFATGKADGMVIDTKVATLPGNAVSSGSNTSIRINKRGKVNSYSVATINAKATKTLKAENTAIGPNAVALNTTAELLLYPYTAECNALGVGDGQRTKQVSSVALATAGGQGYNQINDLVRAPDERTIMVVTETRSIYLPEELRLIAV